ncbi:hypothetical protein M1D70_26210 [Paenibacillus sp. AK002]
MMSRYNVATIDAIAGMLRQGSSAPLNLLLEIFPRTDHEGASFYIGWMVRMTHGFTAGERVSGQSGAIWSRITKNVMKTACSECSICMFFCIIIHNI